MKKYVARAGDAKIAEVDALRETGQFVIVFDSWRKKERRVAKSSGSVYGDNYFDSWDEAHAFLLRAAEARLFGARRSLEAAQGHHGNVVGMKKPA